MFLAMSAAEHLSRMLFDIAPLGPRAPPPTLNSVSNSQSHLPLMDGPRYGPTYVRHAKAGSKQAGRGKRARGNQAVRRALAAACHYVSSPREKRSGPVRRRHSPSRAKKDAPNEFHLFSINFGAARQTNECMSGFSGRGTQTHKPSDRRELLFVGWASLNPLQ